MDKLINHFIYDKELKKNTFVKGVKSTLLLRKEQEKADKGSYVLFVRNGFPEDLGLEKGLAKKQLTLFKII